MNETTIQLCRSKIKIFAADPNVRTDDQETPLHIASFWNHSTIVKLLLKFGADLEAIDCGQNTPIQCAIKEKHYELIDIFKLHLHETRQLMKAKSNFLAVTPDNCLKAPSCSRNLCFDPTSPYYVNISHRRKPKDTCVQRQESPVVDGEISTPKNLFELTETNLREFTCQTPNNSRRSMVDNWRSKISKLQSKRHSNLQEIKETLDLFNDSVDSVFCFTVPCSSTRYDTFPVAISATSSHADDSFRTAESEECSDRQNNRKSFAVNSPKFDGEFMYQITEDYIHTDNECEVEFVERKIFSEPVGKP